MLQRTDWERRRLRYPRTRRPGLAIDAVTLLGCPRDANAPERARRPRSRAVHSGSRMTVIRA
jgi:hypothetical protein